MLSPDVLTLDIILPANAQPTGESLLEGLGGNEVAQNRYVLDVDLDVPQIEQELSPTVMLRKRGERRLLVVDEKAGPLRKNPRQEPIITRDLRPEKDRLVKLVEKLGCRLGRLGALGAWGDAVWVTRSARDLRALALLSWVLDPQTDIDGRRRATPLSEREFQTKMAAYDKRLDELDDEVVLSRIPPDSLERRSLGLGQGELFIVSVLSDIDGSWDVRKSYELEKRVAAADLFARIPGAKQIVENAAPAEKPAPAKAAAAPAEPPPPPKPAGPPIKSVRLGDRIILVIPAERFDLDTVTALGKKQVDLLGSGDEVPGKDRDLIHQHGCGFLAPLAFLSEVFVDGKPLSRPEFEKTAETMASGRTLAAHLPRFGPVRILEVGGKRWVTSEVEGDPQAIASALLGGAARA
jgi:hypothetical protein